EVVVQRFDPVYAVDRDNVYLFPVPYEEPLNISRPSAPLRQQMVEFAVELAEFLRLNQRACTLERRGEPIPVDRLEQVIDRVHLEGLKRVRIKRRDKNCGWHVRDTDLFDDLEAAQSGHLDIEKNQGGVSGANFLDGRNPIIAFADDFDAAVMPE